MVGGDPSSDVLEEAYPSEVPYLEARDPQSPPQDWMSRSAAVDPSGSARLQGMAAIVAAREPGDVALIEMAQNILRPLLTLG